jgi:hypothetical protein
LGIISKLNSNPVDSSNIKIPFFNFGNSPSVYINDNLNSPKKRLSEAKKLITLNYGFKMDSTFQGPIVGRSLGGKIYNGPGKNHDVLGKLQKDGAITILGRTDDRVWLSVKGEANFEGWVLASEVDLSYNRTLYQHHDNHNSINTNG